MSVYETSITNPKKQLEFYKDLSEQLEKDNQELEQQLEELQTLYNNMFKCHCNRVQVETLLSQQKEFIEYLEGEIKRLEENNIYEPLQKMALETFKHILSKYKETIGGKNGN